MEYAPNNVAYHAQVQNYRRFGQNNVQFEGGIADSKRGKWDWGVAAGFTPDANFRPEFHAGGRIGRKFELDQGPTVVTTLHYRYCLLYTSPSPRDQRGSRMPSSA